MPFSEETIVVRDGVRLYARRWHAERPKAEVILVHGFAEHSGRYAEITEHLLSRSYSITAYDHCGHGKSEGLPGHIDRFSIYEDDLDTVIDFVRAGGNFKTYLIGHSMGGLVTLRYLARFPGRVAAAAVTAPLVGFAVKVPRFKELIGRIGSQVAPKLRMTNEIDPSVLSRDKSVGQAYSEDPLVGKLVSTRWFVETSNAMLDAFTIAPKISTPILIMHGTSDKLASHEASHKLFDRIGTQDKEFIEYVGYYHELFNEPERAEIYQKVTDWLEAH